MDAVSYAHSAKQAKRIKKFIENPDSNSGIVTVPKVIGAGENITIPAGRVAVLPNVQVDGTLNIDGEVFIPTGAIFSKVVETEGNQTISDVKTFTSSPIVPTPINNDDAVNKKYVDDKNLEISVSQGVRQTVQYSSVDLSGKPNYITVGTGLSVNIAATTDNVVIHSAGGKVSEDRLGTISVDTSISGLTNTTTNYLYADIASDGTVTLGSTTLTPIYQFGGAISVTSGQFTFNIAEMKAYLGNGSSVVQVSRVFIGEAITSGGSVTDVVNYALNGYYDGGYSSITLPSNTNYNHNIGIDGIKLRSEFKCITADSGYAVGDTVDNPTAFTVSTNFSSIVATTGKNTASFVMASGGIMIINKSTFSAVALTPTNWNKKLIASRGW